MEVERNLFVRGIAQDRKTSYMTTFSRIIKDGTVKELIWAHHWTHAFTALPSKKIYLNFAHWFKLVPKTFESFPKTFKPLPFRLTYIYESSASKLENRLNEEGFRRRFECFWKKFKPMCKCYIFINAANKKTQNKTTFFTTHSLHVQS